MPERRRRPLGTVPRHWNWHSAEQIVGRAGYAPAASGPGEKRPFGTDCSAAPRPQAERPPQVSRRSLPASARGASGRPAALTRSCPSHRCLWHSCSGEELCDAPRAAPALHVHWNSTHRGSLEALGAAPGRGRWGHSALSWFLGGPCGAKTTPARCGTCEDLPVGTRLRAAGQLFCNPVPTTRPRVWGFPFSSFHSECGLVPRLYHQTQNARSSAQGAVDSPRAPSPASVRSPWGVCPTVSKPIPGGPRLLIHASLCAGHRPAVSSLCGGGEVGVRSRGAVLSSPMYSWRAAWVP